MQAHQCKCVMSIRLTGIVDIIPQIPIESFVGIQLGTTTQSYCSPVFSPFLTASSSFLSIFWGLSSYNIAFTSYISDFYLSLFSLTHKHLVYVKLIADFVSPCYNALLSICPVSIKVFQCG